MLSQRTDAGLISMTLFKSNLYFKTICWLLLNLLLLAGIGFGVIVWFTHGSPEDRGVLPASLLSTKCDSALRVISANLQYRDVRDWKELVSPYARKLPVAVHLQTLDTESIRDAAIPDVMVKKAGTLPTSIYTFCPSPDITFWDPMGSTMFAEKDSGVSYGLPPVPPALFAHTSSPSRFWIGRIMYIPDDIRQIHTVLVTMESDSFDGHGFYFETRPVLLLTLALLGISFLWWLPFIRHLSRPLRQMADYARKVGLEGWRADQPILKNSVFTGERRDEIGQVGYVLASMTQRLHRTLTGQRQFIRYVAHELNTPLAKAQMGLGILECKLQGDEQKRVRQVMEHIRRLSVLTEEVLSYLQAKASMDVPEKKPLELAPFLKSIVQCEAPKGDVRIEAEEGLTLNTDRLYLQRCVMNLLRNAQHYAGGYGPIIIRAEKTEHDTVISVIDSGVGVPAEDLPSLCEPFYRGHASTTHPGGTGLGLSIVKNCTESLGGRLEYGNRRPHGFAIRMRFPLEMKDTKTRLW